MPGAQEFVDGPFHLAENLRVTRLKFDFAPPILLNRA